MHAAALIRFSFLHPIRRVAWGGMAGNAHDVAGSKRIGRAIDDLVGRDETARHFNLDAEIPAQADLLQRDLIAVADYRGFQAMLPEQYRACRYQHGVWIA